MEAPLDRRGREPGCPLARWRSEAWVSCSEDRRARNPAPERAPIDLKAKGLDADVPGARPVFRVVSAPGFAGVEPGHD